MFRIKLKKKSNFRSAVKDGVMYLEIPVPFDRPAITPLDVGKVINVCVPYHAECIENELICRIEEYYVEDKKQYIVARVLSVCDNATV